MTAGTKETRIITICVIVFMAILMLWAHKVKAQELEIYQADPDYFAVNGQKIVLFGETPCKEIKNSAGKIIGVTKTAKVFNFDLTYPKRAKEYGVNSFFVGFGEITESYKWSDLKNIANNSTFWNKVEAIAREAFLQWDYVTFIPFSYSIASTSPAKSAFSTTCTSCSGSPGPLVAGKGFFTPGNPTEAVQKTIIRKLVERTWKYPNVLYVPMWESNASKVKSMADWWLWHANFVTEMKRLGSLQPVQVSHMFGIEATLTKTQMEQLDYDFTWDEDGNAQKIEGVPHIYGSCDGVLRGNIVKSVDNGIKTYWPAHPWWNKDDREQWSDYCQNQSGVCEPSMALEFMQWTYFEQKAAGIATFWAANQAERDMLLWLSHVSMPEPPKCPVTRNCEQCHSKVTVTTTTTQ
jgi:hypothetical protein